jgi:hypothetical protein
VRKFWRRLQQWPVRQWCGCFKDWHLLSPLAVRLWSSEHSFWS